MAITGTNIQETSVARFLQLRVKHKDQNEGENGWVMMDLIVNVCYDCFVTIAARSQPSRRNTAWKSSANDAYTIGKDGIIIENVRIVVDLNF